jgi:tRNA-2-methylthio-N6-dimethylallyladenosine synthase
MTSHPKDLSHDLIQCFGGLTTLCEHLHLPVQSGSNRVLKRMNRGYTRESFLDKVLQLRARVPGMALTTDILCGFPGETDKDHQATVDLVRDAGFDAAFMFVYSPRKGTKAARFKETLDRARKVERVNEIIRLQMDITRRKNEAQIGAVHEVLAEGISPRDPNYITARTRTFKNVILKGDQKSVNRIFTVKITGSTGWALRGEAIQ